MEGSGKTVACQLIKLVLTGSSKTISLEKSQNNDFGIILLRSPITILDNVDTYYDWLPDSICRYVSGTTWTRRKLYANDEEFNINPRSFIAVPSKNPTSFRRSDTADRLIVIRLDRRDNFLPLEVLEAQIMAQRPQLFGEYIYYVNQIVEKLRVYNDDPIQEETTRMADFARFVRVVGEVMHWSKESIEDLLKAMADERLAFSGEEDSLVDVLNQWIMARPGNPGRKMNIWQLFGELEGTAKLSEIPFYKSARLLAQNIRSSHVKQQFDVEITVENSQRIYQIWRKGDLRVMDGGLQYPLKEEK